MQRILRFIFLGKWHFCKYKFTFVRPFIDTSFGFREESFEYSKTCAICGHIKMGYKNISAKNIKDLNL